MIDTHRLRAFLDRLRTLLLDSLRSLVTIGRRLLLSARAWVLFVLLVIVALVAYYVLSDRHTPFTTDAYVQAYVIRWQPGRRPVVGVSSRKIRR
jgi:multisubunit Na+/H+ antiporter MnhB subunit